MEADETSAASTSPSSSSLCLRSETKSSGELTGPFPDGLCRRCQDLKIDDRRLGERRLNVTFNVPYSLEDVLPDLPILSQSALRGCKFCEMLKSTISELVSYNQRHQWLRNAPLSIRSPTYTFLHDAGLSYLEVPVKFERLSDVVEETKSVDEPELVKKIEYFIHFEVESVEGDSGSWLKITRRPLEPHPLSEKNMAKFKSWLHQCHADHEHCQHDKTTKKLPTRLLAVGGEAPYESPRIIVCSEHPTLTDCEKTPYIALSHCWGRGVTLMKTECNSLPDRRKGIPLETMPRTYHDAVLLTRSLGISYIWIDSLCIVQDDPDDWKRESSCMAEVYRNAYLTVCALVTSCNDGLFRGSREPGIRIPFYSRKKEGVNGNYFLRLAAVSSDRDISDPSKINSKAVRLSDDATGSSWSSRGWTFQEGLFSTRRLLCCERLMYLDCNIASCSENSIPGEAVSKSLPSRLKNDDTDMLSTWYNLISSYSRRSLTYEQDRLPAISSLAASFAEQIKDKYIAGLWQNDLPHGLLWYRADDQEDRPNFSDLVKRRTCRSQFIAPSWSWACEGRFSEWPGRHKPDSVQCRVLEAWSETDNINSFGSITSAHLVMEGKLFAVPHVVLLDIFEKDSFGADTSGASLGWWYLDFDPLKDDVVDWTQESENHGAVMFILTKGVIPTVKSHSTFESLSGLLLHPTARENEYVRIGIFEKVCGVGEDYRVNPSLLPDFLEGAPYRKVRLI